MSYDLNFWKYKERIYLDNQDVYERLSNGDTVDGLEKLPIAKILQRVNSEFADGWEKLDELNWESKKGAFQIFATDHFFRIDCYDMESEDMNKFIDIANEFDCPLYDPQVGKRYDGR
jgi:hypothetical protein